MQNNLDLFEPASETRPERRQLADGAVVLHGFASAEAAELLDAITTVTSAAPLRRMTTPGGYTMSVEMSNCGPLGWVSDASGYRYDPLDPLTGLPWPPMPEIFCGLAERAASAAGFSGFEPDACLINRYAAGSKLGLHQDRDERNAAHPIVSVSLGLPANFVFGGKRRTERTTKVALQHGDVVVWGGPARLFHHGVLTLKDGVHSQTGRFRFNLTLRRAA
ncbi:DNA oxidative demethylase AlkB [Piscinibacter sakaiensis]|uniref:DNA oxidative demethylase AlkB n=1 Tax=Piscinibacter sakaiensis TaxID=1547922 RepID=UPI003AAB8138